MDYFARLRLVLVYLVGAVNDIGPALEGTDWRRKRAPGGLLEVLLVDREYVVLQCDDL